MDQRTLKSHPTLRVPNTESNPILFFLKWMNGYILGTKKVKSSCNPIAWLNEQISIGALISCLKGRVS